MPWYALSGIYLIIWSALLIHCLFREEFYPVFGRRLATKVFWLLTFVFLNPLLTLIYFVFGFLLSFWKGEAEETIHAYLEKNRRDGPRNTVRRRTCSSYVSFGSAVAIALIGIVLVFFEFHLTPVKAKSLTALNYSVQSRSNEQEDSSGGFQAHFGTIDASNKIQTLCSTSDGSGTRVSMRNIMIVSQGSHDLLDYAMREFQKSLVQLPYVDKVAYYPFGTWPEPGGHLPDVFIAVNMSQVNEKSFLHSRYLKAIIKWTAGSSIFTGTSHSGRTDTLPTVGFDIQSQLEHESKIFGIEGLQAKYKLV